MDGIEKVNEVERVFKELGSIREHLIQSDAGPSLVVSLSGFDSKVMLLCSASYFERIICDKICQFFRDNSNRETMHFFVEKQAVSRKYHTMFDWNANNTNRFFSLFGNDFLNHMKKIIEEDQHLKRGMKDFMNLGSTRNQLVHDNYATFNLDYTAEEIYRKFINANKFVEIIFNELRKLERTTDDKPEHFS